MREFRLFAVVAIFFIEVLCLHRTAIAQNENVFLHPRKFYKKFFPNLKIKRSLPDTSYIKSYPNYLFVSTHVLSPSIRMDISAANPNPKGTSAFRTNIPDIAGFSVGYRFISAGFAFLLKSGMQTHNDYSKSQYRTATIKYNSRGYSFQYKYLRYKGLTDVNTSYSSDRGQAYIKRPDILTKEFQFEGLYNPGWKKYSYTAPFTFSEHQVKSRAGFLFKTGIFYMQLSGDSALIDQRKQQYIDDLNDVKVIRTLSIRLAPGGGGNLVFLKRYYLSLAVFPSYDLYFYKYLNNADDKVKGKQTFVFVLDGKASLGYQSKRLYAGLRYEAERRSAALHGIEIKSVYTYFGVEVGYRFKAPHMVKKVYKDTMPPGM